MRTHILKTAAHYWDDVLGGDKTFEIRRNDRAFQVGDRLQLVRVEPGDFKPCIKLDCDLHKPMWVTKFVSYVFSGDPALRDLGGMTPGYVVLGLRDPNRGDIEHQAHLDSGVLPWNEVDA